MVPSPGGADSGESAAPKTSSRRKAKLDYASLAGVTRKQAKAAELTTITGKRAVRSSSRRASADVPSSNSSPKPPDIEDDEKHLVLKLTLPKKFSKETHVSQKEDVASEYSASSDASSFEENSSIGEEEEIVYKKASRKAPRRGKKSTQATPSPTSEISKAKTTSRKKKTIISSELEKFCDDRSSEESDHVDISEDSDLSDIMLDSSDEDYPSSVSGESETADEENKYRSTKTLKIKKPKKLNQNIMSKDEVIEIRKNLWVPAYMRSMFKSDRNKEYLAAAGYPDKDRLPVLKLPNSADDLFLNGDMIYNAALVYESLRRFRKVLRLSSFLIEDFCAALAAKENSSLLSEIYMALGRQIIKGADESNTWLCPPEERDWLNTVLIIMDPVTWPLAIRYLIQALFTEEERVEIDLILNLPDFPCVDAEYHITLLDQVLNALMETKSFHDSVLVTSSYLKGPRKGEIKEVNLDEEEEALDSNAIEELHRNKLDLKPTKYVRSVQDDICRVCGKQGDLICCDSCPTVLHLECIVPRISEEQLMESSNWYCKACKKSLLRGVDDLDVIMPNRLRVECLGLDRHGRRYWLMGRRLVVEGLELRDFITKQLSIADENTDSEVRASDFYRLENMLPFAECEQEVLTPFCHYYSAPWQLEELIRSLDDTFEGSLKTTLVENRKLLCGILKLNMRVAADFYDARDRAKLIGENYLVKIDKEAKENALKLPEAVCEDDFDVAEYESTLKEAENKQNVEEMEVVPSEANEDAGAASAETNDASIHQTRFRSGAIQHKSYSDMVNMRGQNKLNLYETAKYRLPEVLKGFKTMYDLRYEHNASMQRDVRVGDAAAYHKYVNFYNYDERGQRDEYPEEKDRLRSFYNKYATREQIFFNLSCFPNSYCGGGASTLPYSWASACMGDSSLFIPMLCRQLKIMASKLPDYACHPAWSSHKTDWFADVGKLDILNQNCEKNISPALLTMLLSQLIIRFRDVIRPVALVRGWFEVNGSIGTYKLTEEVREKEKEDEKTRRGEEKEIVRQKKTAFIQVTRARQHLYKLKGEDFRVSGSGGPGWVSIDRTDPDGINESLIDESDATMMDWYTRVNISTKGCDKRARDEKEIQDRICNDLKTVGSVLPKFDEKGIVIGENVANECVSDSVWDCMVNCRVKSYELDVKAAEESPSDGKESGLEEADKQLNKASEADKLLVKKLCDLPEEAFKLLIRNNSYRKRENPCRLRQIPGLVFSRVSGVRVSHSKLQPLSEQKTYKGLFSLVPDDDVLKIARFGGQKELFGWHYEFKHGMVWDYTPAPRPVMSSLWRSEVLCLSSLGQAAFFVKLLCCSIRWGELVTLKPVREEVYLQTPRSLVVSQTDHDADSNFVFNNKGMKTISWKYAVKALDHGTFDTSRVFLIRQLDIPDIKTWKEEQKSAVEKEKIRRTARRVTQSAFQQDPNALVRDNTMWKHESEIELDELINILNVLRVTSLQRVNDLYNKMIRQLKGIRDEQEEAAAKKSKPFEFLVNQRKLGDYHRRNTFVVYKEPDAQTVLPMKSIEKRIIPMSSRSLFNQFVERQKLKVGPRKLSVVLKLPAIEPKRDESAVNDAASSSVKNADAPKFPAPVMDASEKAIYSKSQSFHTPTWPVTNRAAFNEIIRSCVFSYGRGRRSKNIARKQDGHMERRRTAAWVAMKYEKLQEIQNRSRNVREFSKESVNKKINMKPRNFREITKSRIHADMRNALILKLNADDADVIMKKALSFADKKVDEMRKEWQEVRQIRKDRRKKNAVLYKEKLTSYQNEIRRKRAERMKKLQSDHALALQVRKDSAGKAEAEDSDDFEDEMVARDVELEAEKAPSEVDKIEVVMRNVCDVFDDSEEDEQVVENRNEATHAYYASTFVSKYLSGIRDPGNTELPEQFEEKVVDKSASSLSDLSDAIKKPTFDFSKLDISSKLALVKACKTRRNNEPPFVPAPKILNSVRIIPGDDGGKPKILVPKATDVIMADSYELEQLLADELGSRLGPAAIVGDTIRSRLLGRPMPKEYVTPEQTNVEGSKAENEKAEKSAVSDVASSSKTPLHVLANIAVTSAKPLATNSPVNMVSKQVDKIAGFGRFSEIEKQVTEKAQYSSIGQTITAAQAEIRKLAGFGEMKEKFDSYVEPDVKVITPDTVFPIHLGGVAGEPININIPVHIYAPQPATTTAAPQAPAATAQEKKKDTPTSAQSTQTAGEVATAAKQALDKKNLEQTTAPQTDEPNVAANKKIPTPEEKNDVTMDKRENEKEQHLHDAATLLLATAAALKRNEQQNSQAKNLAALRIKNDEREVIASSSCGVERAAIGSDKKKGVTKLLSNGIEEINRRAASAAIAAANYGSRYRKAMRKKKKKASEVSPLSKATDESVSSESGSEEANVPKPSRLEKYTYLRYEWASKITKLLMLQTKIKRNIERVASNPEKRETFESQLADNKSKLYKANGIFITVLEKVLSLQASLCDPTDPKIQATKEELLMIMDEAKKMIVENAPPPGTKIARKKSKKKRDKKAKAGKSRSNEKEGASKSAAVVEKVASKAKVGSERKSAVKEKTAEKRSSSVPPSPKAKLPTEKSVGNGGRKTRAGSKDIFGDSATKKAGSPAATATYNCKCKSQVSRGKPSVNCDQCGKWSHLACVNMTPGQAEAIPQWFCGECLEKDNRSCYCMEKDEHHQDQFVQCDKCDIWYHTRCLLLSPKHIDSGEFICFRCKDDSGTYFEVLTNFMLRKITEHNYESLEDVIEELKTIQQVQPMWWNCELLNEKVMESNKRKKNYNAIKFDLSKLMEKIRQRKYVTIHEMLVELGAAIDLFTSDITKKATFAKNSADLMEMHLMEGLRTLLDEGHIAATAKQAAEKIASKARRKSSSRSSSAMRLEAASPLAVSKVVEEIASVRSAKRKSPGSDVEASKKESDVAGDKTEDESKKIILENASDSTHVVGNTNEDSKVNEGDKKDSESVATDQSTPRSMKRARKPVRTYSP